MRIQVVIPARYASTRLPGKALIDLCGVPMIERTWRQCRKAVGDDQLLVATDDERIAAHCRRAGMPFMMTSSEHLTGTDRVAEVASRIPADYYINVQGDEPLIEPDDLRAMIEAVERHPNDVHIGISEMTDDEHFHNPSVTKAVFRQDMRLLYVSRAPIPTTKRGTFQRGWRPIWIYGFPPAALETFSATEGKTPLEEIEDIEILRLLELGHEVRLVPMSSNSIPVDTPADVLRVEARLRTMGQ